MKIEEALKRHISSMLCSKDFWENDTRQALAEEHIDYYNAVIEALEKQIPSKPIVLEVDTYSTRWKCPTCGRNLAPNALPKCCDECGQRYDWSEVE